MTTTNKLILFITMLSTGITVFGQSEKDKFNQMYDLLRHKSFFEAKNRYADGKRQLSPVHQIFTEAYLDNVFNRLNESNEKIKRLTENNTRQLPDSLLLRLYEIKEDNSLKLFEYKEAKNTVETILKKYVSLLSTEEIEDYKNNLKIWSALEKEPKQQVVIKEDNRIKINKDKAGLDNLKITANKDSLDFIFDTGANLSTTIKSVAKRLNMKIIPVSIEVGAITGKKVIAQLAVCDKITIGNIEIRNAVFLVFNDEDLAFPQIGYQIYGILGFPVIEAFKEIQISKEGYFIVPKTETELTGASNMAMDKLTPFIYIENKQYTFDTGANKTILYTPYYLANQQEIDAKYKKTTLRFGGAGGIETHEGFSINYTPELFGKKISLEETSLILDAPADKSKYFYGNIGQDLIKKFDKLTLNFHKMFIRLD
ncbi:retropepsin-like aspartic protease [Flavobacterium sp.]|uniref:retropepsin-like aspartic protease n=1 Tax=Flavobacterium sp. TaxID=239 RepID=UPI003D6C39E6